MYNDLKELIIGRTYSVTFMDDEFTDLIEVEFAPINNGRYECVKNYEISYDDYGDLYETDVKISVVKLKRINDNKYIDIIQFDNNGYLKFKNGEEIRFGVPLDIRYELNENFYANELDEVYEYAPCIIEDDKEEVLLNVSRVVRKVFEKEMPVEIERAIQSFAVRLS